MKVTTDEDRKAVNHRETQVTLRVAYDTPVIARLELAKIIAGPGGSQLDGDFNGNFTTGHR